MGIQGRKERCVYLCGRRQTRKRQKYIFLECFYRKIKRRGDIINCQNVKKFDSWRRSVATVVTDTPDVTNTTKSSGFPNFTKFSAFAAIVSHFCAQFRRNYGVNWNLNVWDDR
jgi:hypothetical protein